MKTKTLRFTLCLLLTAMISLQYGFSQSCPSGMVSYWRLQQADGSVFADEKGNHDGLCNAFPSQVPGVSGKAQYFSSNSHIDIPSHTDYNWSSNATFTIEFWTKPVEGDFGVIIGRDDPSTQTHWWIGKTVTGKIQWFTRSSDGSNGSVESGAAISTSEWHHVVAIRDGATSKQYLYVDNVLQNVGGTVVSLGGNLSSTSDLSLGGIIENGTPAYFYTGAIDEVAIYGRALNTTEIASHYNNLKDFQIGYCNDNAPVIFSIPVTEANLSQLYTYDVDASGNPNPTYSIVSGPTGMTIDAATGVISWTPATLNVNGHVVVRVANTQGQVDQTFNVFVANTPVCRSGLSAYWSFDQNGTSALYDGISNYQLTGNYSGQATGKVGKAFSFNGTSDSINLRDTFEPSNVFFDFMSSFSIELWMKSTASPSENMVLVGREENENNTQYWLGIQPDGSVALYLRDYHQTTPHSALLQGGSGTLDGNWHYIVATYDATTDVVKLYLDNAVVDEKTQNFLDFGGNDPLNIGCVNISDNKYWYSGYIDELAFYNTALSDAEITSNFNNANSGKGACTYNHSPIIVSSPVTTVNQGSLYSYKLTATDGLENDITSITAVTKPAWLSITYTAHDTTAILSGTPTNSDVAVHNVKLRVSDGTINVDQSFTVEVVNINDAPAFSSTPVTTINEDEEYSYTAVATDADAGAVLTYSAPVLPSWLTFNAETHILSGIPTNDNIDVFDVTIRVNDGTVNIDQPFTITVSNVNDAPVFTSTPVISVKASETYMYEAVATDVDEGDVLTYSIDETSKPEWLTFTAGSTSCVLTGVPTQAGSFAVIIKVSDGDTEVPQGFTIVVDPADAINVIDNKLVNEVYPVPANDYVYFRFAEKGRKLIDIFDLTGNLQKQVTVDNEDLTKVDISDLPKGFYLYKVRQNGKVCPGKITKK